MSEPYCEIRATTGFSLPDQGLPDKVEINGWVPREALTWSSALSNDILYWFTKIDYPFRKFEQIPFPDPVRSEIRRFLLSLDAYIESPNPVIPYRDILYGATQKDFATTLKRIKRKSYETTWGVDEFDYPDWWNDVPAYRISDIGDIFNFAYLIYWKVEEIDDYKWGFEPVKIDSRAIRKFKHHCSNILPNREDFNKIDPVEVLTSISGSIAWDSVKKKKSPHYLLKPDRMDFASSIQPAKRAIIHVSPENTRDSVILDPSSLNTVTMIDQQLLEILRVMPGHIHLTNKEKASKRLKNLFRKCTLFIQRDLRKEGITKPREILKALLEVLHETYPDIEIFQYTSFYDSFSLILEDGSEVIPNRGHGLGMANALTTLMQLTIHEWIMDELINDIEGMYSKVLCINDDFTVGFHDEEYHMESYWDKEDEILSKLSILRAPEKSFTSRNCFVLAERYFTRAGEYEKISYQKREVLLPMACYNIAHAKSYFSATQLFVQSEIAQDYISELISYWGYEFFPNEIRYPTLAGGWVTERREGIDLSIKILEQLPYDNMVLRATNAVRAKVFKRGTGDMYNAPVLSYYGFPNIPEEYWGAFDLVPMSLITEKYGRKLTQSQHYFKSYWDRVLKLRQKVFRTPSDKSFEEYVIDIITSNETTQFYPGEFMINKYHPVYYSEIGTGNDPYFDPNPKLALIGKYNPTTYPFKEEYSIRFTHRDSVRQKEFSLFPKETQRVLKNEAISPFFIGERFQIAWPQEGSEYDPNEDYINPIRVGLLVSQLDWHKGYPELKPQFRHPLIDRKREVFNHLFSLKELQQVVPNYTREELKRLVDFAIKEEVDIIELSDEVQRNLPRPEPEIDEVSDQDSDQRSHQSEPDYSELVRLVMLKQEYQFWNWRSDPESFTISEDVRRVWERIDATVTQITLPDYAYTVEEREEYVRHLLESPLEGVRYWARTIDWHVLIYPPDIDLGVEEGEWSLFADE